MAVSMGVAAGVSRVCHGLGPYASSGDGPGPHTGSTSFGIWDPRVRAARKQAVRVCA